MTFERREVERIARLALLDIAPADVDRLARELHDIAMAFDDLRTFASGDVPPTEASATLRDDVVAVAPDIETEGIVDAFPRRDPDGALRSPRGRA